MQKENASKLHDVRGRKYWEMILEGRQNQIITSPGSQSKELELSSITVGGQLKNYKQMSDITKILGEISNYDILK